MADKSDDLLISISTDVATLRRSLKRMETVIGDSTNVATKKFEKLGTDIDRSMNRSLGKVSASVGRMGDVAGAAAGRLAGVFAAGASLQAASRLADAAKNISNALKVAGLEGEGLKKVYAELFSSAQRNSAPIEALVTLYSRLALTQKELGVSQSELIGFTDKIALALRVGGTSAQEASGALLQLSQALGGGIVRAEEFNSVLEGAPTIAQAVAAGLTEAGGSVSKLRSLVVDGKVSSAAFFRAFEVGASTLDDKVAGAATTTAQQFVRLQNVLQDVAGKIDSATGASDKFGGTIEDLAVTIQQFGNIVVQASDSELGTFVGWLVKGANAAAEFKKIMGGIPGIVSKMGSLNSDMFQGKPLGSGLKEDAIQNRIDQAFESTKAAPKTGRLPAAPKLAEPVKPITLADYPIPEDPKAPKKPRTGRGSREPKEPKLDNFQREIASIKERTASLNAAYAAQASLNPLVEDYGYTVDKARAAQDLLAASMAAGKAQTPALAREIDLAAESYARATSAAERLAEQQQKVRDDAKAAGDAIGDVLTSTVMAAVKGEKIGKAFADALVGRTVSFQMEFSE